MLESKVLNAVKGDKTNLSELKLMAAIARELGANTKQPVEVSLQHLTEVLCRMGFEDVKAKEAALHLEGRYLCARPPWYDFFGFVRNSYVKFDPHYFGAPEQKLVGYFVSIEKI